MAANVLRLAPLDGPSPCPYPRLSDASLNAAGPSVAGDDAGSACRQAIVAARQKLLSDQREDGSWAARREADPAFTARFILQRAYLGWVGGDNAERFVDWLFARQLKGGGWARRPGLPADLSVSVLCYAAIKLLRGRHALADLRASRVVIQQLGGAAAADAETRAWLVLLGQLSADEVAPAGDESLVGRVVRSAKPLSISPLNGVAELFGASAEAGLRSPSAAPAVSPDGSLDLLWRRVASGSGCAEVNALDAAIEEHLDEDYGYMPAATPDADTALAVDALLASGMPRESAPLRRAACWIRRRIAAEAGESLGLRAALLRLQEAAPRWTDELPPALAVVDADRGAVSEELTDFSCDEGLDGVGERLASRQATDGGFAWDGSAESDALATADALLLLASLPGSGRRETLQEGRRWLEQAALRDGGWGSFEGGGMLVTSQAVRALIAAGSPADNAAVLGGVNWLLAHQEESGDWVGEGSVSPTAAAIDALTAAGFGNEPAASAGVDALLETQGDDGGWEEWARPMPGLVAGGPTDRVARRCELHPLAHALAALSRWAVGAEPSPAAETQACLRLVGADTLGG